jgi:hypothetical protein
MPLQPYLSGSQFPTVAISTYFCSFFDIKKLINCCMFSFVGHHPFTTCSVTGPTPAPSPSLLLAQAIFEPNLLPYGYPNNSQNLVILRLPAYEDGTECSEMSAYKIQTPGNYPEENIQHTEHGKSLKSRLIKCNLLMTRENTSIYTQTPKCLGQHTLCSVMLQLCDMVYKDKVRKTHVGQKSLKCMFFDP